MRRKSATLQKIDEILSRALKKRHVPFPQEDRRLVDAWEKAVGPQIAAQSRPERIKKDTLFVKVSNSVWMHQLHFLKKDIISKVNALPISQSIQDIRFSLGQLPPSVRTGEKAPAIPLDTGHLKERDRAMMETCLAPLKDEELKDIVERVMIKELTFRRNRERKAP